MAAVPDVVKRLADDLQWTTDLGNAFLEQQNDVMDAVQRMRMKAKDKGALATNEQQIVETKVIYVPTYRPVVVYGPPVYAYPPIDYPPYSAGAALLTAALWAAEPVVVQKTFATPEAAAEALITLPRNST